MSYCLVMDRSGSNGMSVVSDCLVVGWGGDNSLVMDNRFNNSMVSSSVMVNWNSCGRHMGVVVARVGNVVRHRGAVVPNIRLIVQVMMFIFMMMGVIRMLVLRCVLIVVRMDRMVSMVALVASIAIVVMSVVVGLPMVFTLDVRLAVDGPLVVVGTMAFIVVFSRDLSVMFNISSWSSMLNNCVFLDNRSGMYHSMVVLFNHCRGLNVMLLAFPRFVGRLFRGNVCIVVRVEVDLAVGVIGTPSVIV